MNKTEAENIINEMRKEGKYINIGIDSAVLDDYFTIKQLKAIIFMMEEESKK